MFLFYSNRDIAYFHYSTNLVDSPNPNDTCLATIYLRAALISSLNEAWTSVIAGCIICNLQSHTAVVRTKHPAAPTSARPTSEVCLQSPLSSIPWYKCRNRNSWRMLIKDKGFLLVKNVCFYCETKVKSVSDKRCSCMHNIYYNTV